MKTLPVIIIGLMASVAIGISTARGQQSYSLEDLGVVKEMEYSEAAALNSFGSVVGTAYGGEYATCAFHYDYLQKFIHEEGAADSRAFGINSTSMIVGDAFRVGPMEPRSHATLWKDGIPMDLGVLPGQVSQPGQWHQCHWAKWLDTPVSSATAVRAAPSCGALKPA